MHYAIAGTLLSLGVFLSGAVWAQQGRLLTLEEASSFEKSLLARETSAIQTLEQLYTQPINKKIPCKLPTTAQQLSRSNFRAYWDGQCKDGYAYGLGRDIAISDTHHVEEITVHDGTGAMPKNAPAVTYDYVNNVVLYAITGQKFPEATFFKESYQNAVTGFTVNYEAGRVDEKESAFITHFSPFSPLRSYVAAERNVIYRFTEHTLPTAVDANVPTFVAELLDPKTGVAGGVAVVRFGKDRVQHFMLAEAQRNLVTLPTEYVSHLNDKLTAAAQITGGVNVERARQLEREYLYMACNGKHSISGLDKETSTKICKWRDQFKVPYENAAAKYKQELEQMRQRVALAEQQRQTQQQMEAQQRVAQETAAQQRAVQQQLAAQQEALNRQQSQQAMQDTANALGQFGQQMYNAGQQMLQSVQRQPLPQIAPFAPLGGSRINCVNVGMVTNCR